MWIRMLAATGAAVAAVSAAAACGSPAATGNSGNHSPAPASSPAASGTVVKTATVGGVKVLTNSGGFTLYSFAPDTPSTSKCTGTCAQIWPPVHGTPAGSPGVNGHLSTITRPDGSKQASYNGHPLYTYTADTSPGQDKGNGLNLNGGVWHVVPASGAAAPAPTGTSPGGGY